MIGTRAGRFVAVLLLATAAVFGGLTVQGSPSRTAVVSTPPPSVVLPATPVPTAIAPPGSPSLPGASPGATAGIAATRIVIPRLSIDLPIIEGDGIDAPLHKAAHFPGTAWPDSGSNVYLYAHAREEMFRALWDARTGDEIFLELVDGTERIYVVTEIRPEVPFDSMELLQPTSFELLTLQTCVGTKNTDPRFIVLARPRV